MVRIHSSGSRSRRVAGGVLSVALIAALAFQAAPAAGLTTCSPPSVYPESSLSPGDTAVGHTVIQGTTQAGGTFDVKILGIQPNGIAPGLDFILAQITGPASFLQETGGIVAGMSGSPVYIGSQLVGSTSYGFFAADQTIMGITPAQPMVDLFSYPSGGASSLKTRTTQRLPSRVSIAPALQTRAARATDSSATEFATARQIPMPLAVSGLNGRAMARFNRVLNRFDVPVVAYRAASTSVSAAPVTTPLTAGDSLASGLSYGDLSIAAVGTATATCDDQVVGYGHPLTFSGGVTIGMNAADVLKVIKDPSNIFGGFKMANVTDLHGTVTQDRLAGIRGTEGELPAFAKLKAHIENVDLPKVRDGETDIIRDLDLGPFFIDLPYIAAFGLLSEEDVAFDRIGDGSVGLNWIISGNFTPNGSVVGSKFAYGRTDKFYSEYDATIVSIFELYAQLYKLLHSGFGHVTIKGIKVTGSITQDELTTKIGRVLSGSPTQPGLSQRQTLRVSPGDIVHLRVFMRDHGATGSHPEDLSIRVPSGFRGGEINLRAGRGSGYYFYGQRSAKAKSFADLIHQLSHGEHNYDLVAELTGSAGGEGKGVAPSPTPAPKSRSTRIDKRVRAPQDRVVLGRKFIRLVVR